GDAAVAEAEVGAGIAREGVGATAAKERVGAGAARDDIVAADRRVARGGGAPLVEAAVGLARRHEVRVGGIGTALSRLDAKPRHERARSAKVVKRAAIAEERVVAGAARDLAVARAAEKCDGDMYGGGEPVTQLLWPDCTH